MTLSRSLLLVLTLLGVLSSFDAQVYTQSHLTAIDPPLSLEAASWIWTGEAGSSGARAFRKKLSKEGSTRATCVTFALAADDAYNVWVNGVEIGNSSAFQSQGSGAYHLNVYSVPSPSVIHDSDSSQDYFVTDSHWVTAGAILPPKGFQEVDFDDSKWVDVVITGSSVTHPWAPLHIAPLTTKMCGQSDEPKHDNNHDDLPATSPETLLDCSFRRTEEALLLCQNEKQHLVDQLVVIIRNISAGIESVKSNLGATPSATAAPSIPSGGPPIGSGATPSGTPSTTTNTNGTPSIGSGATPSGGPPIGSGATPSGDPSIGSGATPSGTPSIGSGATPSGTPPIGSGATPSGTPPIGSGAIPSGGPPIG
ncbi:hypothetical protein BDP27DRAFT_1426447 [Rhodocollybia butyracea]|uniref:Lectin n=1 Tax=Rhodocollybia butyracea TaxID=206335 RepID=A0A9P5PKU6_9AGAR|nr:hypothetical protein BDP27DRAFT_1426447 [Rhodocollybia butyracea]